VPKDREGTEHRATEVGPTRPGPDGTSAARLGARGILVSAVIPIGFVLLMTLAHPLSSYFETDPDEGNNLIKALMLSRGHGLYEEIWSDQPPLFTYALRGWFGLFGWSVAAARYLVLLTSAVMLGAVFLALRASWGLVHAIAAVLLLILAPYYGQLSVSVMLGLPALAAAVLAFSALTAWFRSGRRRWLVASAVALGLSVLTKLFTAFLVPVFFIAIAAAAWHRHRGDAQRSSRSQRRAVRWRWLAPPTIWLAVFCGVTLAILLTLVSPAGIRQLVQPHLAARAAPLYAEGSEFARIDFWLKGGSEGRSGILDYLALALAGLLIVIRQRRWMWLVPAAWAAVAYLILRSHVPVWYHHQLLVTIPTCLMAGIATGEIVPRVGDLARRGANVAGTSLPLRILALAALVAVLLNLPARVRELNTPPPLSKVAARDRYLTALMERLAIPNAWVFSDRQMFAFRAGLNVPPELCVTSQKRMASGELTPVQVLEAFEHYDLQQVVFCGWRMPITAAMLEYLRQRFDPIYDDDLGGHVFLAKDSQMDPLPALEAALQEAPRSPEAQCLVGRWLAARGDTDGALLHYRQALQTDPGHQGAALLLAETMLATGNTEEAFRWFRLAYERGAAGGVAGPRLAIRYAWRMATNVDPNWRDGGRAERVARSALRSCQRNPQFRRHLPEALESLAAALAVQGRFAEAIAVASRAEDLLGTGPERTTASQIRRQLEAYRRGDLYLEPVRVPSFP
jgi:tetratricopeptide (TPR) repeat protein